MRVESVEWRVRLRFAGSYNPRCRVGVKLVSRWFGPSTLQPFDPSTQTGCKQGSGTASSGTVGFAAGYSVGEGLVDRREILRMPSRTSGDHKGLPYGSENERRLARRYFFFVVFEIVHRGWKKQDRCCQMSNRLCKKRGRCCRKSDRPSE